MNITIFGAKTLVGMQLIKQALGKNYYVKAFDRNIEDLIDDDLRNDKLEVIKGYVFDTKEIADALQNTDVVISCIGSNNNSTDKSRSLGMKNIIEQMELLHKKRIIALSNIGVLNTDEEKLAMDFEDFPEELKEVSFEHLAAYQHLKSSNLNWTLICPSKIIDKDASGNFLTKENYLPSHHKKQVYAGDVATFILNILTDEKSFHHKISIETY